jgi:C-terminal processing protease CtpA/Prc
LASRYRALTPALLERFARIVEEHDVGGPLRTWGGGSIAFADLPRGLAYLRISAFDFGTEDARADAIEMDRALDEIFTSERVANLRGLMIDVRVSTGGHNPLGVQVASRITRRPYVAYGVEARRPEAEQYTDRQSAWIHPHRGPIYTGPVVLLTSRYTVSAHETFTQALLGRTPEIIRVGENTQGAISDHMFRLLPNGWLFSVPTQRFFSDGVAFDGAGVPPTVRVPVLTPEELERGEDAAFDRAVALLTAQHRH